MNFSIENTGTIHKTSLSNGLRVLTKHMPGNYSVGISVFVGVGSRYESPKYAGISHFIEHLVFKGTPSRPNSMEVSSAVESLGGIINAATEQELTVYWSKVGQQHMDETMGLLIDMLRNSLYDPFEIEIERKVLIEEQAMLNDDPDYRVETLMDDILWKNHPLGMDIAGTKESVLSITREMILNHVNQFYSPSNIVIVVAGEVEHDDVVMKVNKFCDGWASYDVPKFTRFFENQNQPRIKVEYKKAEQSHISVGVPGFSIFHPDRYVLDLLSVVLGEGMSSRLFLEIRERMGLAYDIHSSVTHFSDCGSLVINAGVDPKQVYIALDTILDQVNLLRGEITDDELHRAKQLSTGTLLMRMEDTREVSSWVGVQELILGRVCDVDQSIASISNVTLDDLRRVADNILCDSKLNLAVVGPYRGDSRFKKVLFT